MNRPITNNLNGGRKAKIPARFNYEKFMQLAQNSFKIMKYSRAADNCRLAIDLAVQQGNLEGASQGYQLWLKALFEARKFVEIKKICCEARSRFGNGLDLLYYEFKAAQGMGDAVVASKLAREFVELHNVYDNSKFSYFYTTIDKISEVKTALFDSKSGTEKGTADKIAER